MCMCESAVPDGTLICWRLLVLSHLCLSNFLLCPPHTCIYVSMYPIVSTRVRLCCKSPHLFIFLPFPFFFFFFIDTSTGTSRLICRQKMDLLVSLCVEIFSSAFLLSPSPLCDWQALLGYNRRNSLLCLRTILTQIRSRVHSLPTTLFGVQWDRKNRTLSRSSSSTPPPVPSPHPFLRFPSVKWTLQQAGNI